MHQNYSTYPSSKAQVVLPLRQSTNNTRREVRPAQGDFKPTFETFEGKFPSVFKSCDKNQYLIYSF